MLRHGALHEIADSQRSADLARVGIVASEGNGGVPAQHVQPAIAGEQSDHVLGETVAEIIGIGLLAPVGEWQHGNGRLAR
jgi:hypothetical protein